MFEASNEVIQLLNCQQLNQMDAWMVPLIGCRVSNESQQQQREVSVVVVVVVVVLGVVPPLWWVRVWFQKYVLDSNTFRETEISLEGTVQCSTRLLGWKVHFVVSNFDCCSTFWIALVRKLQRLDETLQLLICQKGIKAKVDKQQSTKSLTTGEATRDSKTGWQQEAVVVVLIFIVLVS